MESLVHKFALILVFVLTYISQFNIWAAETTQEDADSSKSFLKLPWWNDDAILDYVHAIKYQFSALYYTSQWNFVLSQNKKNDLENSVVVNEDYKLDFAQDNVYGFSAGIILPKVPLLFEIEWANYTAQVSADDYYTYESTLLKTSSDIIYDFSSGFKIKQVSFKLGINLNIIKNDLAYITPYVKYNYWTIKSESLFVDYYLPTDATTGYELDDKTAVHTFSYGISLSFMVDDNVMLTLGTEEKYMPAFSLLALDENDEIVKYASFESLKNWQTYAALSLKF